MDLDTELVDSALAHLLNEIDEQNKIIERVREFVDYPGNWSALDGRRRLLLALLDGEEIEWER